MPIPLTSPRIAVFFGGPSSEKDISLDSCRTFVDAIRGGIADENLQIFFLAETLAAYRIGIDWLYSNTIGDFWPPADDSGARGVLTPMANLQDCLRDADAICSFVHGAFGEDGGLAQICEQMGRSAYLGSGPAALELSFSKSRTHRWFAAHKYAVARQIAVEENDAIEHIDISALTQKNSGVVVKPARGGSSDGVSIVGAREIPNAIVAAREFSSDVVIEELIQGLEFSVVAIQDIDDTIIVFEPTAVIPQVPVGAAHDTPFYTRLQKYMPGSGAQHRTPLPVAPELIEHIRAQVECIFRDSGLRDWARLDGFIRSDNEIVWSEINGVPGYGVDGFLFQQAAVAGLSQRAISLLLLERCLNREGKSIAANTMQSAPKRHIAVLGGGASSERAVSRMSWLNVIHKLSVSGNNRVARIFVGASENNGEGNYFEVSAFISLQHTVEEIEELIADPSAYLHAANLWRERSKTFSPWLRERIDTDNFAPRATALTQLKDATDFIFIALHGGFGEDGTLQVQLDTLGIPYNGSGAETSKLCMNKNKTALALTAFAIAGFRAPIQARVALADVVAELQANGVDDNCLTRVLEHIRSGDFSGARNDPAFATIRRTLHARAAAWAQHVKSPGGLVLKPAADGCSSGVLVTREPYNDLPIYLLAVLAGIEFIPRIELASGGAGKDNDFALRMPAEPMQELLLEENVPHRYGRSACIEMTVAVLGLRGEVVSLLPSETPSDFSGLTVEEKFCKGIGRNLTPPPILNRPQIASIRDRIARFANAVGIEGYARIDVFYLPREDELVLIEVNSLPGLSMATVTFTQAAVTQEIKMRPSEFLETVVELGEQRLAQRTGTKA